MKKSYGKNVKYTKSFFTEGNFDTPITVINWTLNWRFPFIHRDSITHTASEWQELLNKALNQRINRMLSKK